MSQATLVNSDQEQEEFAPIVMSADEARNYLASQCGRTPALLSRLSVPALQLAMRQALGPINGFGLIVTKEDD